MAITYNNILLLTVIYILLCSFVSSTTEPTKDVIKNDGSVVAKQPAKEDGNERNILLGLKAVLDKVKNKLYLNDPDAKDKTISPTPTVDNNGTLSEKIFPMKKTYQTIHNTVKGKTRHTANDWFTVVNAGWTQNLEQTKKEADGSSKKKLPSNVIETQTSKKQTLGSSHKSELLRVPGKLDDTIPGEIRKISKEASAAPHSIDSQSDAAGIPDEISIGKPADDTPSANDVDENANRTAETVTGSNIHNVTAINTSHPTEQVIILETVQIVADGSVADGAKVADSGKIETYSQFAERLSAEKKSGVPEVSIVAGSKSSTLKTPKVKTKNYASQDCGAKLLSANDGAEFPAHVINRDKDEYMLNKCNSEAFVIIELCESIKTQKIDVANFELFSNVPKDIRLYGSHRYPVRDWTLIAEFQGEEGNRGVQSFVMDSDKFIKYAKLEIASHYGTEFYCPLSLFRIYGISEFEAIDHLEDEVDDFEEEVVVATTQAPKASGWDLKSLVGSVLNVIKRGSISYRSHTEQDEMNSFTSNCRSLSPSFAVQTEHCPAQEYLNYILSCFYDEYLTLLRHEVIASTVKNRELCDRLSQSVCATPPVSDDVLYGTLCRTSYPCVMLSVKHVFALCYLTYPLAHHNSSNCQRDGALYVSSEASPNNGTIEHKNIPIVNDSRSTSTPEGLTPAQFSDNSRSDQQNQDGVKDGRNGDQPPVGVEQTAETASNASANLENTPHSNVKDDLVKDDTQNNSAPSLEGAADIASQQDPKVSSHSSVNKESIIVRLSNKIKVLEENMSISSQYLEELSQMYKRQMEEMERQFNITITALNKSSQIAFDRDIVHHALIESLDSRVQSINATVESMTVWHHNILWQVFAMHAILILVQIAIFYTMYIRCLHAMNKNRVRASVIPIGNGKIPNSDQTTLGTIHRNASDDVLNEAHVNGSREWRRTLPNGPADQPLSTNEYAGGDNDSIESSLLIEPSRVENLCGANSTARRDIFPPTDSKQVIPYREDDQRHRYEFDYPGGDFNSPVISDYYTARTNTPKSMLRSEHKISHPNSIPILPFNYEGFQSYMQYCYHQSTLSTTGHFDPVGLSHPDSNLRSPSPHCPGSGHSNTTSELSAQDLNSRMRSYDPSLRLTTQDLIPSERSSSPSLALAEVNTRMDVVETNATLNGQILNLPVIKQDSILEMKLQNSSSGTEELDSDMSIPKLVPVQCQNGSEAKKPEVMKKSKKKKNKGGKQNVHSLNGHT